jgi:excisionase family DNA binding protein
MIQIYTVDQVAEMLSCSRTTVEELARNGQLPGIKPGVSWIFPAGALATRLEAMALEQSQARQRPRAATAQAVRPASDGRRRALPTLIDLRT